MVLKLAESYKERSLGAANFQLASAISAYILQFFLLFVVANEAVVAYNLAHLIQAHLDPAGHRMISHHGRSQAPQLLGDFVMQVNILTYCIGIDVGRLPMRFPNYFFVCRFQLP